MTEMNWLYDLLWSENNQEGGGQMKEQTHR